jgi:hypothetical protein
MIAMHLCFLPATVGRADDPPPKINNFFEGWDWFMKVREGHRIMKKLSPQLAAEWWQRQGNPLWPNRIIRYPANVVIGEDDIIALEILIDGPDAWSEMAHLMGPRGTAHLRKVDPLALPPAVLPPKVVEPVPAEPPSPGREVTIERRSMMDDLREGKLEGGPLAAPLTPEEEARLDAEQKEIASRLVFGPTRVAETLWSVLATVPFDAVERFAAHPRVVAIAATVIGGPIEFGVGTRGQETTRATTTVSPDT